MAVYDLYAVRVASLLDAKKLLENLLEVSFEERESGYHRGPYYLCRAGEESFELKINHDPYEDIANEEKFSEEKLLLYVNNTDRSDDLRRILIEARDKFVLLRHENLK